MLRTSGVFIHALYYNSVGQINVSLSVHLFYDCTCYKVIIPHPLISLTHQLSQYLENDNPLAMDSPLPIANTPLQALHTHWSNMVRDFPSLPSKQGPFTYYYVINFWTVLNHPFSPGKLH